MNNIAIFTGTAHPKLAQDICDNLPWDQPLGEAMVGRFSDGEIRVQIGESVRGSHVYIVQPTCGTPTSSVNDVLQELIIMVDALRRASAKTITAVIPYYGYARQDRKVVPRTPITAAAVARQLKKAGVQRIVSIDLHADQIQGFFRGPWDNLYGSYALIPRLTAYRGAVIVSPDAGGAARARAYAKQLDGTLAIIDKRRERTNECEVMHIIGEVKGRNCLIADDMIDTAGTLCGAAKALMDAGAESVAACATHGVCSGPAAQRIRESVLSEVIVTNTIPLSVNMAALPIVNVVSVAPLLAEAIRRIHANESVSGLFTV